jgi:hypothetical protein
MRRLLLIAAAVIGTAFVASTASAQVDTHKGFNASVGGGYGSQTTFFSFDGSSDGSVSSMETTWYAQLGWGLKPQWTFGIEANYMKSGCGECGGDEHFTALFYTAAATWYPKANDNFFLKLNLGYGSAKIDISGEGSTTEGGFAGGLGLGYDWAIGKGGFIVKPFANYLTQFSDAAFSGSLGDGEKGRIQLLQVGVGIGYKH